MCCSVLCRVALRTPRLATLIAGVRTVSPTQYETVVPISFIVAFFIPTEPMVTSVEIASEVRVKIVRHQQHCAEYAVVLRVCGVMVTPPEDRYPVSVLT
jgi:hypothetical protein